jgi:hypothetical protein
LEAFELNDAISKKISKREVAAFSSGIQNSPTQNDSWYCNDSVVAKSLGDLITAHQLEILRRLGRENSFDLRNETETLFGCYFDELSRPAAEALIEYLVTKSERISNAMRLVA